MGARDEREEGARERLEQRVADELARTAPEAAQALTRSIVDRHGAPVRAVLFYGSCLRQSTHEGVLDFYVLVDGYRELFGPGWLAVGNWLLPPNVLYLECNHPQLGTLRTKYAVMTLEDFEERVAPGCWHPYIWSRFSQPALASYVRDPETRARLSRAVAQAILTLVRNLCVFLPATGAVQRFSMAALWQEAFRRTYSSEMRPESREVVRSHYLADPERYDAVGVDALAVLEEEGWIQALAVRGHSAEVVMDPRRRRSARLRWRALRIYSKALAVLRLLKTATTFGDWLPYALWKLQRHTGVVVTPTERQRRHPLIFGWPVIIRLLARRALR